MKRMKEACRMETQKTTKIIPLHPPLVKGGRGDFQVGKNILYSLLLCFMLITLWGCATATTSGVKESLDPQEAPVITGIDVQDYAVTITVNKPFIYTIYRPGDPYKMIIDLPGVSIGAFNNKIVSDKAGITEIVPYQIESPSIMAKIEMLLQTPSIVEPEYKNNVLIVKIKEEELTEQKSEVRSQKSEVLKEEKEVKEEKEEGAEKTLPKATEISSISFEKSADIVKVLIKGNGSMAPDVFPLDGRVVIDIPDVVINTPLPSAVVSPVKGIRSGKHNDKIRLVLDLKEKTNFDVASIEDSIVIALQKLEKEPPVAQMPGDRRSAEAEKTGAAEVRETEALVEGKYTGKKISLDFQDVDIVPIFRLLADISGYNIVMSPEVKGKLTMKLINVPWDQAMDLILKTFSLGKFVEGNIIRIAPYTTFAKESEEAAKAMEAGIKAEPLETRIFPISYAEVSVVETSTKNSKILTPRGSISVDKRTSSMLIKDVASVFPEVENLLATLDRPTPQVLIEARIVEVSTSDVTDLGIQWGFSQPGGSTPFKGVTGLGAGPFTGNKLMVDFPATVGAGSGAGFAFGILGHGKTAGLDLQLSALETMGKGRIISNPRIITTDNEKAKILQGESVPYAQRTAEGTISAAFKDVALSIEVTPHITPANSIIMSITTTKEELIELVDMGGGGKAPRTTKMEGNTRVLVENGETLVIGGVYKKTESISSSGVPGLMKIPILGWLFKKEMTTEKTSELLIFITPRIVEKPI